MKKILTLVAALSLVASLAVGGSIAYLQDTDEKVNVMTLGNVYIDQIELQRTEGTAYDAGDPGAGNGIKKSENKLEPFEQGQKLYPAVPKNNVSTDYSAEQNVDKLFYWGEYVYSGTAGNGLFDDNKLKNVMDKFVFVENTGKSDAYVRTIFAFECPEDMTFTGASPYNEAKSELYINTNIGTWAWEDVGTGYFEIDGVRYCVMAATYDRALAPGNTSHPSLLQVVLTHNATNEDMELLGDTYEILTLSQAVQTAGFEATDSKSAAQVALDAAFGEVTEANVKAWLGELEIPKVTTYKDVNYVDNGNTVEINSVGGDTVYRYVVSDGMSTAKNVEIGEGITRLDNRSLCKNDNFTSVKLPSSLTYIDESVFQQSGFTEIEIPENVTYIGKQAMGACANLEKIVIRAKNVTIANYVARACANLKEVYIYSDDVTFESGSMYFTNKENADASGITFYVKNQDMANNLYNAFSTSHSYGLLIKSIDGNTTYYNTLK